jgi:hypothetical protein
MNTFRIIENSDIDKIKWDDLLANYPNPFPYAQSWYLDIVSPKWKALIVNDFEFVLPLPCRKKWGFSYVYPPEFTQQMGVFGKESASPELIEEIIKNASKHFSFLEFNLNQDNKPSFSHIRTKHKKRKNLELDLSSEYELLFKNFHKNTQRNIKKAIASGLEMKEVDHPDLIISTFLENKAKELKGKKINSSILENLYSAAKGKNAINSYHIYKNDAFLGGAIFLNFVNRKVFLFSSINTEGRENRAMFFLINSVIELNAKQNIILDFEGSDNSELANFYHRFGAKEKLYLHVVINRLPLLLKWLKN